MADWAHAQGPPPKRAPTKWGFASPSHQKGPPPSLPPTPHPTTEKDHMSSPYSFCPWAPTVLNPALYTPIQYPTYCRLAFFASSSGGTSVMCTSFHRLPFCQIIQMAARVASSIYVTLLLLSQVVFSQAALKGECCACVRVRARARARLCTCVWNDILYISMRVEAGGVVTDKISIFG